METDELEDLYHETILDHRRNPRNHDKLEDADIVADGINPFCGDEVHIQINLDDGGRITEVGLQGVGCSINQAAGSMLAEVIDGESLDGTEAVSNSFRAMMEGNDSIGGPPLPGDLQSLSGVKQFPVRIKCALLAWSTLEEGLERYRRDHAEPS